MCTTPKKARCQDPDVVVVVGRGEAAQEFKCYKVVLSLASPYFNAMLGSSMKEAESNRIEFQDRDPNDWKLFYHHVVENPDEIDADSAMKLSPWFHEFDMPSFLAKCDRSLTLRIKDMATEFGIILKRRVANESASGSFRSLVHLLEFACKHDLVATKRCAEKVFRVYFDSIEWTIAFFPFDVILSLVEMALPIEVEGEGEEKRFVARGKSTVFWDFLGKDMAIRSLNALKKDTLTRGIDTIVALAFCWMHHAKDTKLIKNRINEQVSERSG